MLRLVHPAPPTQPPRTGKRHHSSKLLLTAEESRHLAAALQNLRRAFGTWACLADAMGLREEMIKKLGTGRRRRGSSPAVAIIAARTAGMSVEAILSGTLSPAGRCETCGARIGEGRMAHR